ncbi:MAG: hypothetical protein WBM32_03630 [Crocosphaera sp.]|jgi:hypothetical protein
MTVQYQFTNASNWSLLWSESYNAEPVLSALERFYPIPNIVPGLQLSSPIFAIHCSNNEARENWRYAARYLISLRTGITVNGGVPDTVIKVGRLYLDQIEIIQVPSYSSNYGIEIDVPYWHRNFNLRIWEYTGNNQNTIDNKLDQLLGNPQPN